MALLLLDRDGVINEDRPDYVRSWDEFQFLPRSLEAMRALAEHGHRIAIVTNQSAVGRGLMSREALAAIHRRLVEACAARGVAIERVFVCPHAPWEGCGCRKPRPGLLLHALRTFREEPRACLFVGDSLEDLLAAWAVDVPFVLVRSGRGAATLGHPLVQVHSPLAVVDDLWEVAQRLVAGALPSARVEVAS